MNPAPEEWLRPQHELTRAEETLRAGTFMLRLPPQGDRPEHRSATGFFFSSSSPPESSRCPPRAKTLALTAYHVIEGLPDGAELTAYYPMTEVKLGGVVDLAEITLRWLRAWSDPLSDLAVLELVEKPDDLQIVPLPTAYLDPKRPERLRRLFFAGHPVSIYGFPLRTTSQESWRIDGALDTSQPIVRSIEVDSGSHDVKCRRSLVRLNIQGSRVRDLEGVSGAAILARELELVIGVEGSYNWMTGDVRGSEISPLVHKVPKLAPYFQVLMPTRDLPKQGIVAVVPREDAGTPQLIPISVHFGPGTGGTAVVSALDKAVQDAAREAVNWVGGFMRRFKGKLWKAFEAYHWRGAAPYGAVTFSFAVEKPEAQPQLRAGMALAYLARVLRDLLVNDLELPVEFPNGLLLVAAGMDGEAISTAPGLEDDFSEARLTAPVVVLCAATQREGVAAIPELPQGTRLVPVETQDGLAQSLLAELLAEVTRSAEPVLRQRFAGDLRAIHEQERALKEAHLAAQGREAQLAALAAEIEKRERQLAFLHQKTTELQRLRAERQSIPPASELAEQFGRLDEEADALEPDEPSQAQLPGDLDTLGLILGLLGGVGRAEDEQICNRLYRRLAMRYHPDRRQIVGHPPTILDAKEPRVLFHELAEHKTDRLWLETLHAAIAPLEAASCDPGVEVQVEALIDRLFYLQCMHQQCRERQDRLRDEIEALGGETQQWADDAGQFRDYLSALKYHVDEEWRTLNSLAGGEPGVAGG